MSYRTSWTIKNASVQKTNPLITTFTGRRVDPFNLSSGDIHIEDIAHSLSNLCRFTGHTREFYSVAQHCVLVSYVIPSPLELYGILHDAAEAYFNDLSTPIKHSMGLEKYRLAECEASLRVFWRFGLEMPNPAVHAFIKEADAQVYEWERHDVMYGSDPNPANRPFIRQCLLPADIKPIFLNRFNELFQQRDLGAVARGLRPR